MIGWGILLLSGCVNPAREPTRERSSGIETKGDTTIVVLRLDTLRLSPDVQAVVSPSAIGRLIQQIDSVLPNVVIQWAADSDARTVDGHLQIQLGRIHRVVRCGITIHWAQRQTSRGIGYGVIRYETAAGQWLALPAVYDALIRAIVSAVPFPILSMMPEQWRRSPVPLLVVGGLVFAHSPYERYWTVYERKIVLSYQATTQLVHQFAQHPYWVVFDLPSRDSLYAKARLFGVENYNPPTAAELRILEQAGVSLMVIAVLQPLTPDDAVVRLHLYRLVRQRLQPEITVQQRIHQDAASTILTVLQQLTVQLVRRYREMSSLSQPM